MTDNWQPEYRALVLQKARVDALVRELWSYSESLSKRMAAYGPPALTTIAVPLASAAEPPTAAAINRSVVCNYRGAFSGDEAWCDLWYGHEDEGFLHYFESPRTYYSREAPISIEKAIELGLKRG